jgi:diguanylate cyclase (GGDEF)-like protein/PAS domain S-box-containing protein
MIMEVITMKYVNHEQEPDTVQSNGQSTVIDYSSLLQASLNSQVDTIILAIDQQYQYLFFNNKHRQAMEFYYGVSVSLGMNLLEAIPDANDRQQAKHNYELALNGQANSTIQTYGTKVKSTFETFYSPLYNDQQEVIGATAYSRDVSQQVQAQQQLIKSEEKYRLLYEAMNQGIALHQVIRDEHGQPIDYRYLQVNDYYEQMTGLQRENLIGRRVSEVLPLTEHYWWEAFAEVSTTRQPKRVINYSAELGKYYSIAFYSPQVDQVAGIVDDITDLITVKQQLVDSESRYKLLAQQSQTMIWEIDTQGKMLYVSPVIEQLLGYAVSEVEGKFNYQQLYPDQGANNQLITIMNQAVAENGTKTEQQLMKHNHQLVWVETYMMPIYDQQHQIVKYRGSDRDITDQRVWEQAIVYANQHDYLTSLLNRRYFDQLLNELDVVDNLPLVIMMGDVNGLKLINDAFGHKVGDDLLIGIGQTLIDYFTTKYPIARLGGDEFGIILTKTTLAQARVMLSEVKQLIESSSICGIKRSMAFGLAAKDQDQTMSQLMVAAENDMYHRKLYESRSQHSDTIKTILQTLHEKNPREEAHSKRVAAIALAIGKALQMSRDELMLLHTISNLHDIGKIAIDENILNKPGSLDQLEWETIKKHPDIGFRILSTSPRFAEAAIDILAHHERYDGKGYPLGLAGDNIPLRARIIAIADAFDAMISERTYRSALSQTAAIDELLRCKATQFDPQLVDIFLTLINDNDFS